MNKVDALGIEISTSCGLPQDLSAKIADALVDSCGDFPEGEYEVNTHPLCGDGCCGVQYEIVGPKGSYYH